MKVDVSVIIPIITLDNKEKELLITAIESVKTQKTLPSKIVFVVPKNSGLKEEIESIQELNDVEMGVLIFENDTSTDFCSQINFVTEKIETEWFSILELDDVYSKIWFNNFDKYLTHYPEVDIFLPIVLDVDSENNFIHFTNEPVWARDFSENLGFLDNDTLLNFPNFQLVGSVIRTKAFNVVGKLKPNIKMFFNYEFLLRASYYSKKIMTIPKVGYKKINMREGSLFWKYKNVESEKIDQVEQKFWFTTSKKESYHKVNRDITYEVEDVV